MNRIVRRIVLSVACCLALVCATAAPWAHADSPPPQSAQTPQKAPVAAAPYTIVQQDSERLVVELPNRLIVIAQEVHTAPVLSAQVWVKTGSVFEQEHVGAGLSHFLEHLLAGGETAKRPELQARQLLGSIGAQFNASTSLDNVRYYINTTSDHTEIAVDLLSDWMQHGQITETEYQREREVIQREFEMGDGEPARILWKAANLARYRHHPARHPTIGYLDEFRSISREEIQAFYHRMYVPNNMVFVVVGDIDRKKVVDQIASLWADAKPQTLPTITLPSDDKPDGPTQATALANIDRPRLQLMWPGTRLASEHDYAMDILAAVLGEGESSRLIQTVRDQQRLVNTIGASNLSESWSEGTFFISSEIVVPPMDASKPPTPEENKAHMQAALDATRDAILAEVEKIKTGGVTDEELARVKRQVLANAVYGNQTDAAIADRLANDTITMGDPDYLAHYSEALKSITSADVQAAAKKYLVPERMITVTLMPQPLGMHVESLKRPTDYKIDPGLNPVVINLDNQFLFARLKDNLDKHAAVAGEAANRISPPQLYTLPNGLRVVIERNATVPALSIQLYQLGGLLSDQPGREGIANASMSLLMRGTTKHTGLDLARIIENLGASVAAQCGNNTAYIQATCLRDDWSTVLDIFAECALEPAFSDDEWKRLQPRLVANIVRQTDSWGGELAARFRETYYGAHPWSQSPGGRAEVVGALTTTDIRHFYQDHLSATDTVLVVVGDVDPAAVKARVETLFGGMPAKAKIPLQIPQPPPPVAQVVQIKTIKQLAAVRIGYGPGVVRNDPDFAQSQVLSRVMSAFPAGRLEQELRGRGPGLVYAVGAGSAVGIVPGYFGITFNCTPAKVPEALSRSIKVVDGVLAAPVSESDLARARSSVVTDEFSAKQSNNDRAADDALNVLFNLGLDEPKHFLEAVNKVTPQSLQTYAKKALVNPVIVVITNDPVDPKVLDAAAKGEAR